MEQLLKTFGFAQSKLDNLYTKRDYKAVVSGGTVHIALYSPRFKRLLWSAVYDSEELFHQYLTRNHL